MSNSILRSGRVAVVTGAALGIGRAMCSRFAEAGMPVVMADLPGEDFDAAVEAVRDAARDGAAVLAVATDVSDPEAVGRLHEKTVARFGRVDVLANNAVTRVGRGFDADIADWRRAMEVNLWGPVYGVRAFLPSLMASGARGFIINVGSKQGITNPPGHPIYNMAKSALKTYTEALEHELRSDPANQGDDRVSVHLLVPGWTTTGKNDHKPGAWLPDQVVDTMIDAIDDGDFYIICQDGEVTPEMDRRRILWGAADITENRPPLSRWHPDFAEAAKAACS
jgi:NAD(P)-dependent dehydrogenase (short-subunit alcohol dehydrogenase family)